MVLSLELKAAGAPQWREVVADSEEPLVRVEQLTPGTKYTFRSRIGAMPGERWGCADGRAA